MTGKFLSTISHIVERIHARNQTNYAFCDKSMKLGTVFTRIEARASISFRDFVDPACKQDQACNQGRLLFFTLLSCTSVVMIFTCFHFR